MTTRTETDSMGAIEVPAERLWGAQTQRSLEHFDIGRGTFVWGPEIIRALGVLKQAAAGANRDLGELPSELADAIEQAAGEVAAGRHDDEFPLVVFQTGSGTQSNMNANEVIANRANRLLGAELGAKSPVHPNDHVNKGQSSNDTFPTAMHIAVVEELHRRLYPGVTGLRDVLAERARAFAEVVKPGRTHLQDATPVLLGDEMGGWVAQLDHALAEVRHAEEGVLQLAIGGTAVGTGLGAHPEFGAAAARRVAELTGHPFRQAGNLFAALAAHDELVVLSGALRVLAGACLKIANDVRWLASGPRNGLGELSIPENEPGSSIMPGKVNPTQAEALTMVAARVFGNDATVGFAGSQGNFELNVYKPVMAHAVLESVRLLGDATVSFARHCAAGIEPRCEHLAAELEANLMLVTALSPRIGYDAAARIAKRAAAEGLSIREAAAGEADEADLKRWLDPRALARPHERHD